MKVNISIDDISPHPHSGTRVLSQCFRILEHFPSARFTLFIPLAYWRTVPRAAQYFRKIGDEVRGIKDPVLTESPLFIKDAPEFCDKIRNLPSDNFEIGIHGLYHGIPGQSNGDEFRFMNYAQSMNRFLEIFNEIDNAKLSNVFKSIFRPPAWRMNPNSINAARDSGIKILSLSSNDYALQEYGKLDTSDVVFYDAAPRDEDIEVLQSLPARDYKPLKTGRELRVVYHACEWDKNYLNDTLTDQLIEFLKGCSGVEFVFMNELERGNYG